MSKERCLQRPSIPARLLPAATLAAALDAAAANHHFGDGGGAAVRFDRA